MCVEDELLQETAIGIARDLAAASPTALRLTKYALNNWLRTFLPIFDTSLALEMLSFGGRDAAEAVDALINKRKPSFGPNPEGLE